MLAKKMGGRLYVVATPLGNLQDLSPRALETLRACALVACEDTRRTGALLRAHRIRTPTTSFFEHNEREKGSRVLEVLERGDDVALVSDAGTPCISDPGYRLVRDARARGIAVLPVPGPSAVIAALSVSGLPTDRFLFVGFLPRKPPARRELLRELQDQRATLVFYESPLRLAAALDDLVEILGERDAFLCREATKLHEEYLKAPLAELRAQVGARARVRGEVVLVVEGARAAAQANDAVDIFGEFGRLQAQGRTRREAVKELAKRLGLRARDVYGRLLADESEG
jgi:16S rRNA (cytidine1402-2'-O)-methyltransferase